ncbi:MAG: hypothetical protein ABI384_01310 [Allobranchiibius sp.]
MVPETDPSLARAALALAASEDDAASRVKAAAEKWIGGVSSLIGLFSLAGVMTAKDALKGLSTASRVAIAAGLVLTIVAAAASLILAYTAAYGWPGTVDVSTNEKTKRWYERLQTSPQGGANLLRWAVLLALVTVGLLLVVVMLLWFLPRTPVAAVEALRQIPLGNRPW